MANWKKWFLLYADQHEIFDRLTDEKAWKLIKHIMLYVNDLWPTEPKDPLVSMAFVMIKQSLKRDLEKREKRAERSRLNGLKWWRPKTQKTQQVKKEPKEPDSVNVSVSDNVNDNVNDIKTSKEATVVVYWKQEVNDVIDFVKNSCLKHWLIYSWKGATERQRAKNLLQWPFTAKIKPFGYTLEQFIDNVIFISTKLRYNTKQVTSAKDIFYNWEEIVNKAKQQKQQSETAKKTESVANLWDYMNKDDGE